MKIICKLLKSIFCNKENNTYRKPTQIISLHQAIEMYDLYTEERVPLIQEYEQSQTGEEFHATRSGWYDFNTMKEYLGYVEQESKKLGIKPSGLRFYFSKYPNEEFQDGKPAKYPRRQSFFITPTVNKGHKKHLGFSFKTNKHGDKEILYLEKEVHIIRKTSNRTPSQDTIKTEGLILNEVGLMPPPKGDNEMDSQN